jgi:hypothetical protein
MANIKINELMNLNLTGADLFNDPESFMIELSAEDESMGHILGGLACGFTCGDTNCGYTGIVADIQE